MDNQPTTPPQQETLQPIPEQQVSKNLTWLKTLSIGFSLVSFGIAIGIGGYILTTQKNQPASQNQQIVSPTPDPTENWKIYRNEKYKFETKYYPQSNPNEYAGKETDGQFTYLLLVKFGTNPIKFPYGYELKVNKKQSLDTYRSELIGHITDKIDSEEDFIVNNYTSTKLNYKIFVATDYVPITTAIINHDKYSYLITSSSLDINQILSTFKFTEQK